MKRAPLRIISVKPLGEELHEVRLTCWVYVNFHWHQADEDGKVVRNNRRGHTRTGYRKQIEITAYYFKDLDADKQYYLFEEDFIARNLTNVPPIVVASKTRSTERNILTSATEQLPFLPNTGYSLAYSGHKRINRRGTIYHSPHLIIVNVRDPNRMKYKLTLLAYD